MKTEIHDDEEFAIETTAQFLFESNDFASETAYKLITAIYKNLGFTIIGYEDSYKQKTVDALMRAICKKGEFEGYNGDDYCQGYIGFDTAGRSTRKHTLMFSDAQENAAFDAGRKFAEILKVSANK